MLRGGNQLSCVTRLSVVSSPLALVSMTEDDRECCRQPLTLGPGSEQLTRRARGSVKTSETRIGIKYLPEAMLV